MPMRYADETAVLRQLSITDSAQIDRIVLLENGLADTFDGKVGRTFGVAPVALTRIATGRLSELLILPGVITSVDTVTVDDVEVLASRYDLWLTDDTGSRGLLLNDGTVWDGYVDVTGIWADGSPGATVPDDVREALTFLTVDEYRVRVSSPAGQIGPDGLIIPVRNPWKYEIVTAAIQKYRVLELVV